MRELDFYGFGMRDHIKHCPVAFAIEALIMLFPLVIIAGAIWLR